ncbi:hypothetical protein [Streptosporangium sp. NBC_01469]|uniref:hypothetical protein n=1 Tax=Streptosporangium sp. NBC_01469 TaxID=2903898 RepID=UPI002E27EDA0|nr:hypothetical protein [Streptosporangium sp. NBC_01469]
MSAVTDRIDEIDVQMERISRLIGAAQNIDRELAAGLGCTESLSSIQSHVDRASASVESLHLDLRKYRAQARK